jgi:hypothetical protein
MDQGVFDDKVRCPKVQPLTTLTQSWGLLGQNTRRVDSLVVEEIKSERIIFKEFPNVIQLLSFSTLTKCLMATYVHTG